MLTDSATTRAGKRSWREVFRPAADRPTVPQFGTKICKFPVGQMTPRNASLSLQLVFQAGKWSSSQESSPTKAADVYSCREVKDVKEVKLEVNYLCVPTFVGRAPINVLRMSHMFPK